MTLKKLERQLEAKCVKHAEKNGYEQHIKMDDAKRFWPDRAFFGPGRDLRIVEFKVPGREPDPGQDALHRKLEALGFDVYVVDNYEQFVDLVAGWTHLRNFNRLRCGFAENIFKDRHSESHR